MKYLHGTIFQADGKPGIPEQQEQAKIKKLTCQIFVCINWNNSNGAEDIYQLAIQ